MTLIFTEGVLSGVECRSSLPGQSVISCAECRPHPAGPCQRSKCHDH